MLICSQASAQLLPIRTYGYREGLNTNSINTVFRDSRGMLWVGTFNGVNWYDGSRFIQPRMTTPSGQIYVNNFIEDSQHSIWITTFYSGLYQWKDGRFTNWLVDPHSLESTANNVFDLVEIKKDQYLVATDFNVYLFDGHSFKPLMLPIPGSGDRLIQSPSAIKTIS